MFDIKPDERMTETEKMLYLMLQELQEIKKLLLLPEEVKQETSEIEIKPTCQYCGGYHENNGQKLSCAKKNKRKDGAKT